MVKLFQGSHKTPNTPMGSSANSSQRIHHGSAKNSEAVNCHFDDVESFLCSQNLQAQYKYYKYGLCMFMLFSWYIYWIILYSLAQLKEMQLIHTNLAILTYLQHNETLHAKIWSEPSPNKWFQSTNVWRDQGPVDTKIQHSNAALQKILFDACAHSEEHKWCGMHIHEGNLNVPFVRLHVSTKNAHKLFNICSWHIFRPFKMQLILTMWHVFEKPSANCLSGPSSNREQRCVGSCSWQLGSFSLVSVANTRTWHKLSAVTHRFQIA